MPWGLPCMCPLYACAQSTHRQTRVFPFPTRVNASWRSVSTVKGFGHACPTPNHVVGFALYVPLVYMSAEKTPADSCRTNLSDPINR
eukprot:11346202-Karenia_brevis.AAC.1